jgi:hypothetical protein
MAPFLDFDWMFESKYLIHSTIWRFRGQQVCVLNFRKANLRLEIVQDVSKFEKLGLRHLNLHAAARL